MVGLRYGSSSVFPQIDFHQEPQNVTLFGHRVMADVISEAEIRSEKVPESYMTGVLTRREGDTGRQSCKDYSDVSASQEPPGWSGANGSWKTVGKILFFS